ncbi:MAG: hypothetical protein JO243_16920 [Solirubrobacterales bacterium]|nr:hypothetical protein [Solirubrobacterales bacterium]
MNADRNLRHLTFVEQPPLRPPLSPEFLEKVPQTRTLVRLERRPECLPGTCPPRRLTTEPR